MENNGFTKLQSFAAGLGISILVLVSFFLGALADRVFVIQPLDYFAGRDSLPSSLPPTDESTSTATRLNDLLQAGQNVPIISDKASESVVTVSIKQQQRSFQPSNFWFWGGTSQSQELEEVQRDIGTGFVVEGGLIVTNKHVVSQVGAEYTLIDREGREYPVTNIYRDPINDLAILRVEGMQTPALVLGNSDAIQVGEAVIAIGTALGQFRHTVTTGVISGIGRGIEASSGLGDVESLENVIQTDAAINPGNSGGPLVNMNGEVIGVNVAVSVAAQNVGFALPINVVRESIDNFARTGEFNRPFLGVRYQMISEQAALLNEVPRGALLREIVPNSTATALGLEVGDIVTKINGTALSDSNDLAKVVNSLSVGDRIEVSYWRDDELRTESGTVRGLE
jgi:serine protease Do